MQVTLTGHAGCVVEAEGLRMLCDPWFGSAFGGSWRPYPDNSPLWDRVRDSRPDAIYISHSHQDHCNLATLEGLSHRCDVIVSPQVAPMVEPALRRIGFRVRACGPEGVAIGSAHLRVIDAGPVYRGSSIHDSVLQVETPTMSFLHQNDARLPNMAKIEAPARPTLHLLHHSGAVWFPHCYELGERDRRRATSQKVAVQRRRVLQAVRRVSAEVVILAAGPPAFLDDELFILNDTADNPSIFKDSLDTMSWLQPQVDARLVLPVPGTVVHRTIDGLVVDADEGLEGEAYGPLKGDYLDRMRSTLHQTGGSGAVNEAACLADAITFLKPLVARMPVGLDCLPSVVVIVLGRSACRVDFRYGRISAERSSADDADYLIDVPIELMRAALDAGSTDWTDALLLSMRCRLQRRVPYSEGLLGLLSSLSAEGVDRFVAEHLERVVEDHQWLEVDGVLVARHCPHMGADLAEEGVFDGGMVTCSRHGHVFRCSDGACVSGGSAPLPVRPPRGHAVSYPDAAP